MNGAAIDLTLAGVPVFPLREDKRPATPHGFLDAVDDPEQAAELWRRYPGPLIGVPTGAASGLDALDIDPRHGGDQWWTAHRNRIPRTRVHSTRSGGLHVLFRHSDPVRNTAGHLGKGVDTRGEGGYIVWWPAAGCDVVDEPVQPWPAWLLGTLLAPKRAPAPVRPHKPYTGSAEGAERIAGAVLRRLARTGEGQRHYALRKAAYAIGGVLTKLPFGRDEAVRHLVDAVHWAGAVDLENARKTALWGLERGEGAPLSMQEGRA